MFRNQVILRLTLMTLSSFLNEMKAAALSYGCFREVRLLDEALQMLQALMA